MIAFFALLALALFLIGLPNQNNVNKVTPVKSCPPHKWRYEEIKDHEGVTHTWKIVCDVCGPLKPMEDFDRTM